MLDEFEPYKTLWLSASAFYDLQNACMQNPLANIEKSTLEPLLNNLLNIVTKSVEQFAEIPGNNNKYRLRLFFNNKLLQIFIFF